MIEIIQGDCREVLAGLEADSFHACVTDPPYHLTSGNVSVDWKSFGPNTANKWSSGRNTRVYDTNETGRAHRAKSTGFMGKQWDGGDVAFRPETWAAVLRVLKPGAYLCAFGSTRGYHRMACAAEDAGFIIHPMVAWIFASGFPKATNFTDPFDEKLLGFTEEDDPIDWAMSRSHWATYWEGWRYGGQALKPAIEPILVAQKPFAEPTGRENVLRHGTGAINIDACRVGTVPRTTHATGNIRTKQVNPYLGTNTAGHRQDEELMSIGTILDGPTARWPANVAHDGSPEVLDAFARFGESKSTGGQASLGAFRNGDIYGKGRDERESRDPGLGDIGTGARFFMCAKADASERVGSHPTVKPVAMMEWLVRLITPPNGRVIDPFCGTGSTLVACDRLGFDAVGIEQDAQTVADAHEKLKRMRARRMIGVAERVAAAPEQMTLW